MSSPRRSRHTTRTTYSCRDKTKDTDRGRHRSRVREFITNLSRDLSAKRKMFSSSRSRSKDLTIKASDGVFKWKPPSAHTIAIVREIFATLFSSTDEMDLHMIERALTLCAPDEDLLLIEDRDHYNLLHKAIILDSVPLLTILLNHGCDVDGAKSSENCAISQKKCPHDKLGALHLASFLGHLDIVLLLLQRGADRTLNGRVYTSEVLNDPHHLQPQLLHSSQLSRANEILSKCGCRQPIFYAVVGNHVEIVKVLLGDKPSDDYGYLVHLACRVGAYDCLQYLLDLYPNEMDRKDSDGLPLLLMALNNDLRFVILLLQHGADIHILSDLWAPGSNILHLLFTSLPLDGTHDMGLIGKVTDICLSRGVSVNSLRSPFHRTPLHDLMTVVNLPVIYDPGMRQLADRDLVMEQTTFDEELIQCLELLLSHDTDVNLRDSNNKTPLQILLSNGNHTVRCNMYHDSRSPRSTKDAMKVRDFGMHNTSHICRLLLKPRRQNIDNRMCSTPLIDIVEMICSSYFGSDFWAWVHSLEILEISCICKGYLDIIKQLLEFGFDPNICPASQLPPLLYLISHVSDSPYTEDYQLPVRTAHAITQIMSLLLRYGARTEVQVDSYRDGVKTYSSFDMIVPILTNLQRFSQNHSEKNLEVVAMLSLPLLQYGAKALVYQKLLYRPPSNIGPRWSQRLPYHSVLYQLLMFGLNNLKFVNGEKWFKTVVEIFYSYADHYVLIIVMRSVLEQLAELHPLLGGVCPCGSKCASYRAILVQLARTPRSLKQLCRLVINKKANKPILEKTVSLRLPRQLKEYLTSFER